MGAYRQRRIHISFENSKQTAFKWLRGVGEDEFLATEDGKLAKYDLQNRLTMIPMPEGVTRINGLKNTGYQLLMATNLGVVIYNPRTFKFDIINVQSSESASGRGKEDLYR